MKWIGQHIYDLTSRFRGNVFHEGEVIFRNDVFLEDISSGTIASGAHLGLDSNNKIVKAADGGGDVTLAGIQTFTGSKTFSNDTTTLTSANANDPLLLVQNTANDATSGRIRFLNNRGADGQDGDSAGMIQFYSYDDGTPSAHQYGRIQTKIDVAASGQESGDMIFSVANHDGGVESGLTLTGGSVNAEVDVAVGTGAASVTTIAGTLTMGSTATINNSGVIQVARQTVIDHDQLANFAANEHFTQANITTLGTIGTGVWNGTAIASAYIADDAVTFAKAIGVTPNVYGSTIKVLPSDFMANEEAGATKTVQFVDNTASGLKPGNASTELLAFVSIPEGMKATLIDVYDEGHNLAVEVYEVRIDQDGITSRGSGNANTQIDITDVNATATNYLMIQVTTTATSQRVHGALVTIAAQ